MRNIFNQYDQPENRVTHALCASLAEDRRLLKQFVKDFAGTKPPKGSELFIDEQTLPGEPELSEAVSEKRGLPDACIHDGENWCLIVESKVAAAIDRNQLRRHLSTIQRRGFDQIELIVLSPQIVKNPRMLTGRLVPWSTIYLWLKGQSTRSSWAQHAASYMEVAETRFVEDGYLREGTLTDFYGFAFGPTQPYSYGEAKRLLRLAIQKLRSRKDLQRAFGVDPNSLGRKAITGKDNSSVWDYLPIGHSAGAKNFTSYPHLTLSVETERVIAAITLPNGMQRPFRRRLIDLGEDGLQDLFALIEQRFRSISERVHGASPYAMVLQRYYPSQRSPPIEHARLEFDLRTASGNG